MNDYKRPVKVFGFWSFVPCWWAKIIVWATGNQLPDRSDAWSHCGLAFEMNDGSMRYYEALIGEGFDGPKPIERLHDKIRRANGRVVIENLDMVPANVWAIYDRCNVWVGKKGYYAWQLILMLYYEKWGRWVGWHIPRSKNRVVCSEAQARLIWPYMDLREGGRDFDESNPNSTFRRFVLLRELEGNVESDGFNPPGLPGTSLSR